MDKINLSNQAILVELNIRVPSFRKLDKKVKIGRASCRERV